MSHEFILPFVSSHLVSPLNCFMYSGAPTDPTSQKRSLMELSFHAFRGEFSERSWQDPLICLRAFESLEKKKKQPTRQILEAEKQNVSRKMSLPEIELCVSIVIASYTMHDVYSFKRSTTVTDATIYVSGMKSLSVPMHLIPHSFKYEGESVLMVRDGTKQFFRFDAHDASPILKNLATRDREMDRARETLAVTTKKRDPATAKKRDSSKPDPLASTVKKQDPSKAIQPVKITQDEQCLVSETEIQSKLEEKRQRAIERQLKYYEATCEKSITLARRMTQPEVEDMVENLIRAVPSHCYGALMLIVDYRKRLATEFDKLSFAINHEATAYFALINKNRLGQIKKQLLTTASDEEKCRDALLMEEDDSYQSIVAWRNFPLKLCKKGYAVAPRKKPKQTPLSVN